MIHGYLRRDPPPARRRKKLTPLREALERIARKAKPLPADPNQQPPGLIDDVYLSKYDEARTGAPPWRPPLGSAGICG